MADCAFVVGIVLACGDRVHVGFMQVTCPADTLGGKR